MAAFKKYFVLAILCLNFVADCKGKSNDDDSWGLGAILVGVGTAIVAPYALPALGFGAAGVTAGSIAAAIQTPATVAGSAFAIAQSAGAVGVAGTTKALIGTAAGSAYAAVKNYKKNNRDD